MSSIPPRQPSHDWAAKDPLTDFSVNANGTLVLLEATRKHCPDAVFIFTSTNKVYGDNPNRLPLVEQETRWEVDPAHPFAEHGIDEIDVGRSDASTRSSAFPSWRPTCMVQEYGRYFGMKTGVFRGGCLTGPGHSGTMLHGFLSYLVKCAVTGQPVHGLRLQGQAGPRQHPLLRPGQHVLAVLPGPAARRGLQRGRRPAQQLLDDGGDRHLRADGGQADERRLYARATASATTSGTSATPASSRSTIRHGRTATTSSGSWKRSSVRSRSGWHKAP